MTQQRPMTIKIQERWGSAGFETLLSDGRTAYAVSFTEKGALRVNACKITSDGNIEFDHHPDRGIAIDLEKSQYSVWGLKPKDMSTIYQLFGKGEGTHIIDMRERIAELEHEQWVHMTEYLLRNLTTDNIGRWNLLKIPYSELSEEQKDKDRVWADKVMAVIAGVK